MSRGYCSSVAVDCICKYCGNINIFFDNKGNLKSKFSEQLVYCPVCQCETVNIMLGDKDLVAAQLDSCDILEGIEYEVWDLLELNKCRKRR